MTPPLDNEAEWRTRKERIDTKLRALAWAIIPFKEGLNLSTLHCHAVMEFPTANGPADYALFVDGKLYGIIEAKKVTISPQNVLEQAKRYAGGVKDGLGNWDGLHVPFLYATNGEIIWFLDVRNHPHHSWQITHFHAKSALSDMFANRRAEAIEVLRATDIRKINRLRDYQVKAIEATESALASGKRELLVAMATGTGKTFTTVSQIYRLMASGLAKRILFLVDRKALAAQAVREFHSFTTPTGLKFSQEYEVFSQKFRKEDFGDDDPFDPKVLPSEYLTKPKSSHAFVYVSTIQRMAINLFGYERAFPQAGGDPDREEDAAKIDIPINAFDLIVADECHRGYSAQEEGIWKDTLQHFDCPKIGLTATPAAHTVAMFGEPVFRYGVEQAIRDGHLVDYDAVAIKSEVRLNGVFLREGEKIGKIDTETGQQLFDEVEDEREFSSEEIERKITAPDSNKKIIEEVARYATGQEQQTGRFPKMLIFATNDLQHTSHADQLVRICREVFKQGDEFVAKITGNPNVDRPLQKIREFRNRPTPKIVVTVDMLSTGVDIPSLEFIVFLRPVKSRILWEQMLGRGTRKCDDINKSRFVVFDCFDGTLIKYFRDVSNFDIEPPNKTALSSAEVIENIWQNVDRDYHSRVLVKRLQRVEKDMSAEARKEFSRWIPNGDMGTFAAGLIVALKKDFTGTMAILRNQEFQKYLVNYDRAKRPFWVAHEVQDNVASREISRYGQFDSAEDYLEAFSKFIKSNQDKITALRILLHKPKEWKPEVLDDLKQVLRQNAFEDSRLEKAHREVHHKNLVDIISMIKHAARDQEPILTAEERVDRAIAELTKGWTLKPEQNSWLGLIRQHLVKNLSLSLEDFDIIPIFTDVGGRRKAKQLFGQELEQFITDINAAIAA